MNKNFKIFVDFDGTISKTDVGEAIFKEFADESKVEVIIDNLLNDRITARECWLALCDAAEISDKNLLDSFIDTIEIDPSFVSLKKYCCENNFDLYVLSDGFDYYIQRIFRREGLLDVKVYSNTLSINETNKLLPSFPYFDSSCQSSANCKRNHIINLSGDDDYTVFIGDGNSDKYTAQFCDFIFAKDDLLKYCERERITYFPYRNFDDVVCKIKELNARKRLKKRHQAELKRKEAYTFE